VDRLGALFGVSILEDKGHARNELWDIVYQISSVIIGSPKRRVECTNNASKYQFALSSPHSFVICRAPQALN
jgi:hypothetical protein